MNKKNIRRQSKQQVDELVNIDPESQKLLENINKKISSSAALNGGFDNLLYKIEGIEKGQSQIVSKVDKIHEAIYHPDEGLFSRIASNKSSQNQSISNLEKKLVEINAWKQTVSKSENDLEKETNTIHTKVYDLESTVKSLKDYQINIHSTVKWFAAALGGGVLTIIFKVLYTLLTK